MPGSDTNSSHSPAAACQKNVLIMVNNNNPLCAVESREAQSKVNITYGKYYQDEIHVGFDHEINANVPYLPLCSALMNTFTTHYYAIIVLEHYVMALVKGLDSTFYVHIFDSHSRNSVCMPDCDGTAVVMKCFNINYL